MIFTYIALCIALIILGTIGISASTEEGGEWSFPKLLFGLAAYVLAALVVDMGIL